MLIASFDIGEKNFAYCIADYRANDNTDTTADASQPNILKVAHHNVILKKTQTVLESCVRVSALMSGDAQPHGVRPLRHRAADALQHARPTASAARVVNAVRPLPRPGYQIRTVSHEDTALHWQESTQRQRTQDVVRSQGNTGGRDGGQ